MRAPTGSLLDQTYRLVVRRQMEYGARARRAVGHVGVRRTTRATSSMTYQYSSFGVPGLGLKRGLGDDLVVAPYATALAAMVDAPAAARNFRRLAGVGADGAIRLLRSARLHAGPPAGRAQGGRGARVHGPPSGHDARRVANVLHDGAMRTALSRRADRAGQRTAAAGAHAARRRRRHGRAWTRPSRGARARTRAAGARATSRRRTRQCRARTCCRTAATRDDHGGGIGLQPLARSRGHPLARGRDPRRWGIVHLPARRGHAASVWSAGFQPSGVEPDSYDVTVRRGSRGIRPPRRGDHDARSK